LKQIESKRDSKRDSKRATHTWRGIESEFKIERINEWCTNS